ncbi:MAG: hypothetical protein EP329_21335 [Deltaproteobacteria bacterium]|nr:MAG: hypothetical protein EP329_21335 [Deltaproteobacteria bacterium]
MRRKDEPLYVERIPARVDGADGHRLMVILAAPGCTYWHETGGCTNCAFPVSLVADGPVAPEEYAAQLAVAAKELPADGPVQVDLYVSGSFFNPDEVPLAAQRDLVATAAGWPRVRRVLVESRPEYVDAERLTPALEAAGDCVLDVAIGLESASAEIRDERIHKGFNWRRFEKAAADLAAAGAAMTVYVLLKPLDTGEREAIEDAVATCEAVFALAERLALPTTVALEPCFVPEGTPLYDAFVAGRYSPPRLWSVVEVVERVAHLGAIHVGLSDEGLDAAQVAHNCASCTPVVRGALRSFNRTADVAALAGLDCACREA